MSSPFMVVKLYLFLFELIREVRYLRNMFSFDIEICSGGVYIVNMFSSSSISNIIFVVSTDDKLKKKVMPHQLFIFSFHKLVLIALFFNN